MGFPMNRNLRLHLTLPLLAVAFGLGSTWWFSTRRGLAPLDVVRHDELLDGYDTNYWASLQTNRPADWQACSDFCRQHPRRPNCETLAHQAFTETLRRDAARAADLPRNLVTENEASSVRPERR